MKEPITGHYAQHKVKALEQAWQRQTDSFTELARKNLSK